MSLAGVVIALGGLSLQAVTETGLGTHQVHWLFALAVFVHVTSPGGWSSDRGHAGRGRRGRSALDVRWPLSCWRSPSLNLPFHAHDLGPTADRAAASTLRRTFHDLSSFDPGEPVIYDTDNVRVFEPYSWRSRCGFGSWASTFGSRTREWCASTASTGGRRRRGDPCPPVRARRGGHVRTPSNDSCVRVDALGVDSATEQHADVLIDAAAGELSFGSRSTPMSTACPTMLADLVTAALTGDRRRPPCGWSPTTCCRCSSISNESTPRRRSPPPSISASAIVDRVNSTLMIVAVPASACDGDAHRVTHDVLPGGARKIATGSAEQQHLAHVVDDVARQFGIERGAEQVAVDPARSGPAARSR